MKYLFNSSAAHIANLVGDRLHAPSGESISRYIPDSQIFIDMSGRCLAEILSDNRLMFDVGSPYGSTNFWNYGNHGNAGNYRNPGNSSSIGIVDGFRDVAADWIE